ALAVLLSLLLAPAVRWLHLCGVGRNAAVLATVLLAFIVIIGFGAAVGEQVIGLVRNLPQYEENIAAKIRSLNGVPGARMIERATRVFSEPRKPARRVERVARPAPRRRAERCRAGAGRDPSERAGALAAAAQRHRADAAAGRRGRAGAGGRHHDPR